MSSLAQEEVDRLFSQKDHYSSHPEDRFDHEGSSSHSSNTYAQKNSTDYSVNSEKDEAEDDHGIVRRMTTTTTTAAYRIPTTRFNANTGPKGVISDAQAFNQAKKSSFRSTLATFTHVTQSPRSHSSQPQKAADSSQENSLTDNSDDELGASDDEDFMKQWRENRLKELASTGSAGLRRHSPSKRIWGTFEDVDANGYLDAVEKVPNDAIVVVCIYDPLSNASAAVEDSLATLSQKHITTRFIKLDHEIAEMEHIAVPAILAYRAGEVFATLSGCRPDGLETTLRRHGVLG